MTRRPVVPNHTEPGSSQNKALGPENRAHLPGGRHAKVQPRTWRRHSPCRKYPCAKRPRWQRKDNSSATDCLSAVCYKALPESTQFYGRREGLSMLFALFWPFQAWGTRPGKTAAPAECR